MEPNGPGFPPAELRIATDGDMRDLGRRLAALLRAGDLVILAGPLGAGKTTLVQGIGAGLGVRGPVTSPTFVIARVHRSTVGGPDLVHVDAYRLLDEGGANSGDPLGELDALDLDTELENAVVIAEWGGGLVEQIAERYLFISIDREPAEYAGADEDVRRFTWSWRGGL